MAAVALPLSNVIAYTQTSNAWPFHLEFLGLLTVFNHVTRFKDEKVSLIARQITSVYLEYNDDTAKQNIDETNFQQISNINLHDNAYQLEISYRY